MAEEAQGTPAPQVKPEPTERKKPGPKPKPKVEPKPEPSIGRIVRYVTGKGTIRPAIISKVHEDGVTVDLTVFNSEGAVPVTHVSEESIEQEWIETAEDIAGTYHWPL